MRTPSKLLEGKTKRQLIGTIHDLEDAGSELRQRLLVAEAREDSLHRHNSQLAQQMRLAEDAKAQASEQLSTLELLAELSREFCTLDLALANELAITKLAHLLQARQASLYLLDEAGRNLTLQRHSHERALPQLLSVARLEDSPMARALDNKVPLALSAPLSFSRRRGYETVASLLIPLVATGKPVGVLNLSDPTGELASFDTPQHLRIAAYVSQLLGLVFLNCQRLASAQADSLVDPVTGLASRRRFEQALTREHARFMRYGHLATLLLIEVDHFRQLADNRGAEAAGAVMAGIGKIVSANIRAVDFAARYGEATLAVLSAGTDPEQAGVLADRLRRAVHGHGFHDGQSPVQLTVSIGLATTTQARADAVDLLTAAHAALYRAHAAGGNQVI